MVADRVRPRTAAVQHKSGIQQQPMKKRGAPSRYTTNGVNYQERSFQMHQAGPPRGQRYEDPESSEPEFKAAKRVQSADLLSKLKVPSLKKYCNVHNICVDEHPITREELFNLILNHWKRQVVDDKQVLRKFAHTLQQRREDQE
ncbi:hypothetical protein WJX77_000706 [Trebouxia sp. C0004]